MKTLLTILFLIVAVYCTVKITLLNKKTELLKIVNAKTIMYQDSATAVLGTKKAQAYLDSSKKYINIATFIRNH